MATMYELSRVILFFNSIYKHPCIYYLRIQNGTQAEKYFPKNIFEGELARLMHIWFL